jgi:hypothetical protein
MAEGYLLRTVTSYWLLKALSRSGLCKGALVFVTSGTQLLIYRSYSESMKKNDAEKSSGTPAPHPAGNAEAGVWGTGIGVLAMGAFTNWEEIQRLVPWFETALRASSP